MMFLLEIIFYFKTFFWVVIGSLLMYFTNIIYEKYRILTMVSKFDSPKASSVIFGHMKELWQPIDKLGINVRNFAKAFHPHYHLRILYEVSVVIFSPEDCEIIMGTKKHTRKSEIYRMLQNWLKEGLLLSSGDKWFSRRRILTPAFHFNILKGFVSIFNEHTEKLLEKLSEKCDESIDVVPLISESTLLIITETAMGCKLDPNNDDQKKYLNALYSVEEVFVHRLMRVWLMNPILYMFSSTYRKEKRWLNILHKFTRDIVNEKLRNFKRISNLVDNQLADENEVYMSGKKKRLAMLDILVEAHMNGEISYDGICEEVDTFMFEGHDTTSLAISYALMLLANHPEIQEQLNEEITSILGPADHKPDFNDLQKMDLLERCIKETLRLYPSVHCISRLVDEDTALHTGLVVPKNCRTTIFIADLHRNPKIYPDPDKFNPDRFLLENCQNRHPYAYIPFSAGPRNCIGQRFAMLELKAVLAGIIQRFKLKAVDTPDSIVLVPELVLRSKNGIKLKFEPRSP